MPHDKYGNYLTIRQYIKKWEKGIEGVTPLQQAGMTFRSTWIILLGITLGIFVCFLNLKTLWWLLVILIGALFNTIIQQIAGYQRLQILRRLENE